MPFIISHLSMVGIVYSWWCKFSKVVEVIICSGDEPLRFLITWKWWFIGGGGGFENVKCLQTGCDNGFFTRWLRWVIRISLVEVGHKCHQALENVLQEHIFCKTNKPKYCNSGDFYFIVSCILFFNNSYSFCSLLQVQHVEDRVKDLLLRIQDGQVHYSV